MRTNWMAIAAVFAALPLPARAEAFRVETDVYVEEEKEPILQTVTLFTEDVVYDFLLTRDRQEEITIFDTERGRLILLDPARKWKTTLSTDSILGFVAQMKAHLIANGKKAIADPKFERTQDAETGWLTLASDQVTYRVQGTEPPDKSAVLRYQEFADWYARLNAMRQGNVAPFARLRVNAELSERGLIPETVERRVTFRQRLTTQESVVRSQHLANWTLSRTDHQRIDRAGTAMAEYQPVRYTEFIGVLSAEGDEQ